MSTWTTPATSTGGSTALTAAFWNTEVRDHLNFVKGALDLLTNATSADTGTAMYLRVTRPTGADASFYEALVGADTQPRWKVFYDNALTRVRMAFGPGGASVPDIFLDRPAAAILRLADAQYRAELAAVPGAETVVFDARVAGDTIGRWRTTIRPDGIGAMRLTNGTTTQYQLYVDTGNIFAGDGTNTHWIVGSQVNIHSAFSGTATFSFDFSQARIIWAGDGTAAIRRTGNGRLVASGRFGATDGFVNNIKAGAPADGDYAVTPESGIHALDTTNSLAYWRVGSTWRAADLYGGVATFGPFQWTNLAASQTDLRGGMGGVGDAGAGTPTWQSPFAGSIVGISVRGSAAITAGGASAAVFKAQVAGATVNMAVALDSTTNTTINSASQGPGVDTFTAGQTLAMSVTTSGTFAPTTTEYVGFLFVLLHRW